MKTGVIYLWVVHTFSAYFITHFEPPSNKLIVVTVFVITDPMFLIQPMSHWGTAR